MGKTLFINGVIRTMDDKNSVYEAMLVKDGRIEDLGDYDSLKIKYDDAEIIDLQGRLVLPGFTESHIHVIEAARSIVDLNLKGIETFEEFKSVLISFSKSKDDEWVIGSGWDEKIFEGNMPNRYDID
ncbi:MAG: amidohydrolase family protein, partial [Caloramator sp.]|nr:amidohydrolase family protein [Caloramator sp.]